MLKRLTFALCLLLMIPAFAVAAEVPKALDAYLALSDDSYRWEISERLDEQTFLVDLTSQTWQGIAWKHSLVVVVPKRTTLPNHVLLVVEGGTTGSRPDNNMIKMIAPILAQQTGMSVALLLQVPNQPLLPRDGNRGYSEDALIGESLLKALETKDATWPLLFPMTKSVVKAMDAIQDLLKKEKKLDITGFIVGGASKRGWTTWMTAASGDKRVTAIVPMVIDNLNTGKQMEYQIETWGEYSASINDYTERNILRLDNTPQSDFEKELWTMIDPYSYRSRLTMPKLLVHGTNDPYWTVDATKWYFDDLPGAKFILTIPNAGHDLGMGEAVASGNMQKIMTTAMGMFMPIAVFARHAAQGGEWPTVDWKLTESDAGYQIDIDTNLPLRTSETSSGVKLWTAESETKDFRQATWTAADQNGSLSISVPKPKSGHIAFYVEIQSQNNDDSPRRFSVTTQVWRY